MFIIFTLQNMIKFYLQVIILFRNASVNNVNEGTGYLQTKLICLLLKVGTYSLTT